MPRSLPSLGLHILLVLACLALAGCLERVEETPSEVTEALDERPVSTPTDQKIIRMDFIVYNPGQVPGGVGEPVQESRNVADEWEAAHPGFEVRYLLIPQTAGAEGELLKTQFLAGNAPEILHQNAEIAWPDIDKGWYVPLDEYLEKPNPYVPDNERWGDLFFNQALLNAKRAPDGKLYAISYDIIETGIFYNKDLFAKAGIERLPETWVEFQRVCDTLRELDVIPLAVSSVYGSDWGQDILFEMLYHDILPDLDLIESSGAAADYLGHYLDAPEAGFLYTKGFFSRRDPRWREMYRILKEWRADWNQELKNTNPTRLFLTQKAAMFWTSSDFNRRISRDPYVRFDYGVFYIPSITKETSPYGSGTPATVIGGAALQLHVTNSAPLRGTTDECIDYLMWLTAPENIERITKEAGVFIPNVKGAEMTPNLAPFRDIFQRRYCAIKWLDSFDGVHKKSWRRWLDYFLNDGESLDEFIVRLDAIFADWVEAHRADPAWNFERMEAIWQQREARLIGELDPQ